MGDNAEPSPSSFHPLFPHAQTYQDIVFRSIVETTGIPKITTYIAEKADFLQSFFEKSRKSKNFVWGVFRV